MGKSEFALHEGSGGSSPTPEDASRVFTDYVRSLDGRGAPPDEASLATLWQALRGVLVGELRRRGLWTSPPSFLGIYGFDRWGEERGREDALDELVTACYSFNFVERLRALRAQLRIKPNIEGLVFRNIRNFIHERQRQHDPLGYHLFSVLRAAVGEAVSAGELRIVAGDRRIRNDTVLSGAAPVPHLAPAGSEKGNLPRVMAAWCGDLMPELITARGRRQGEVVAALRRRLAELPREGFETFELKQLMDALKIEVRGLWAALFEQSAGEVGREPGDEALGHVVQLYRPEEAADRRLESRQSFHELTRCVAAVLERKVMRERTRQYLDDLWQFLRIHAAEPSEEEAMPDTVAARAAAEAGDKLPSQRKLAELLQIPRDRLPELYAILGEILERCRAAISGKASVTPLRGKRAPAAAPGDDDD